jgi:hypothetical protein
MKRKHHATETAKPQGALTQLERGLYAPELRHKHCSLIDLHQRVEAASTWHGFSLVPVPRGAMTLLIRSLVLGAM